MPNNTRTVTVEDGQLKADITVRPSRSIGEDRCTFCSRNRHDLGMLTATVYCRGLEVTVRLCGECLADAGVREILPEVAA